MAWIHQFRNYISDFYLNFTYNQINNISQKMFRKLVPLAQMYNTAEDTLMDVTHCSQNFTFQILQLSCNSPNNMGDRPHLLVHCYTLAYRRSVLFSYWEALA